MRPHTYDEQHNSAVGRAFRHLVGDLIREGYGQMHIDQEIGAQVNEISRAAYDLGVREVQPSQN